MTSYSYCFDIPSVETYQKIRLGSGLSGKTSEAAARGLPNSLFAVQIVCDGQTVGMGRVIGDGGCFYQVVDIAILKAYQGQGLGKMVMRAILEYIEKNVPESAYVSLIADGEAHTLYAQFGFVHTAPRSVGMAYRWPAVQEP